MISPRLASLLLALLVVGCAAPRAGFQIQLPAEIDVGEIDRVAVAEFDGLHDSGRLVAAKLTEGIVAEGRFRMFEREKIDEILDERDFSESDVVDPATAHELKLLGVDALIFGIVDAYSVDDQTGFTSVEEERATGETEVVMEEGEDGELHEVVRDVYETVTVKRRHVLREGTMGVTFRMANVHTGEIVAIKAETAHFSEKAWADERGRLRPKDRILDGLAREVTTRFLRQIQPQWAGRAVSFEENDLPGTEVGIAYAQSGLWPEAALEFQRATRSYPGDATAHYNLGVARYALGDYPAAEYAMRQAIALDPRDGFIRTLAGIQRDAERAEASWRVADRD